MEADSYTLQNKSPERPFQPFTDDSGDRMAECGERTPLSAARKVVTERGTWVGG